MISVLHEDGDWLDWLDKLNRGEVTKNLKVPEGLTKSINKGAKTAGKYWFDKDAEGPKAVKRALKTTGKFWSKGQGRDWLDKLNTGEATKNLKVSDKLTGAINRGAKVTGDFWSGVGRQAKNKAGRFIRDVSPSGHSGRALQDMMKTAGDYYSKTTVANMAKDLGRMPDQLNRYIAGDENVWYAKKGGKALGKITRSEGQNFGKATANIRNAMSKLKLQDQMAGRMASDDARERALSAAGKRIDSQDARRRLAKVGAGAAALGGGAYAAARRRARKKRG